MYFSLRGPLLFYYDKYPGDEYTQSQYTTRGGSHVSLHDSSPIGVLRVVHVKVSPESTVAFKVFGASGLVLDLRVSISSARPKWVEELRMASQQGKPKQAMSIGIDSNCSTDSEDLISESRDSCMIHYAGYLKNSKAGKKYFVLQGNMLSMLDNADPWTVPSLRGYVLGVQPIPNNELAMEVSISVGESLLLRAGSRQERRNWIQHLSESCGRSRSISTDVFSHIR